MPSQWWISLNKVPLPTRMEHLHAVVTKWFDVGKLHWDNTKPYSISPLAERNGEYGFQVGMMLDELPDLLMRQLNHNPNIRLGQTKIVVSTAEEVKAESWEELQTWNNTTSWKLELLTPTTHRTGTRNSPLPNIPAIVRGLSNHWQLWSTEPNFSCDIKDLSKALWVSDLAITSTLVELQRQPVSGAVGLMQLRCTDVKLAPHADRLLRLANYSGIGSFTLKGCGVCEVQPNKPHSHQQDN